ncbi:MAG: hypothetical protein IT454_15780 [Planctomycetes bacterium]|nr:hypothetical protein [Planctomycetota bacterium]
MTSEHLHLSPEVEALVRDIAAEPGSTLLRAPRLRAPAAHFIGSASVPVTRTGLSAAERELLAVHREEVARSLRDAATHRLLTIAEPKYHVADYVAPNVRRTPLDVAHFRAEMRELEPQARAVAGNGVLDALLGAPVERWPSVLELATLSQRFASTDQARILVALALIFDDQPRVALRILEEVATRRAIGPLAANAWSNAALAQIALDDRLAALQSQRRAALLGETTGANAVFMLINAVLAGRTEEFSIAAAEIEARFAESDAAIESFLRSYRPRVHTFVDSTTRGEVSQMIRCRSGKVGASARRVLSVFL